MLKRDFCPSESLYGAVLSFLCVLFGHLLALCLIYRPVLQFAFAWHDDYYSWMWDGINCSTHTQYNFLIALGRTIGGPIICSMGWLLSTFGIQAASFAKFLTIFYMAITGTITSCFLQKNGLSRGISILLSFTIFTFPFGQTTAAMVYNTIEILGMIPAALAAVVILPLLERGVHGIPRAKLLRTSLLSALLLMVSLSIYQTAAMYFWSLIAVAFIPLSLLDWKKYRTTYFCVLLLNFVTYCVYYVSFRLIVSLMELEQKGWFIGKLVFSPWDKAHTFLFSILPMAFNPWNLWLEHYFSQTTSFVTDYFFLICFFLAFGLTLLFSYRQASRETMITKEMVLFSFEKIGFFLLLIPLSVLPVLIGNLSHFAGRMCMASTALLVFGFFRLIERITLTIVKSTFVSIFLLLISGAAAAYGALQAHHYVLNDYVIPIRHEITYLKSLLKDSLAGFSRIHVILPTRSLTRAFPYLDEYGQRLAGYSNDLPGIVISVLDDLGDRHSLSRLPFKLPHGIQEKTVLATVPSVRPLQFSFSRREDYKPFNEATLLVEFDKLVPIRHSHLSP